LRRVRASTLILSGDKDRFVLNSGYYPAYSKLIPDCVHEVMAGAGHRVEEEEPQQSAERAIAFLSRNR
jgi:pimeloyl-ACP methyl ester carboxylesterase